MSWLPLTGFDFAGLVDWLLLAPQRWEPPSRSTPFSRFVTLWRLCSASWSPPLFPRSLRRSLAYCLAAWPLPHYRWSRPWTDLCWSHLMSLSSVSGRFVVLPRQLVGSGVCSPASTIYPPSSVAKQSSFGLSASVSHRVFALRSPFRVESVSVLDRNEDSSSTFLVWGWSLRDEVTLSGRVCLISIGTKTLRAPSLVVGAEPSRWDHPYRVVCRVSTHSIGMKAFSVHLSLVASRWGHPTGRVWIFSHTIVTKSSLDIWSVFLQDGVTLVGSGSDDLISSEGITTVGLLGAFFPARPRGCLCVILWSAGLL